MILTRQNSSLIYIDYVITRNDRNLYKFMKRGAVNRVIYSRKLAILAVCMYIHLTLERFCFHELTSSGNRLPNNLCFQHQQQQKMTTHFYMEKSDRNREQVYNKRAHARQATSRVHTRAHARESHIGRYDGSDAIKYSLLRYAAFDRSAVTCVRDEAFRQVKSERRIGSTECNVRVTLTVHRSDGTLCRSVLVLCCAQCCVRLCRDVPCRAVPFCAVPFRSVPWRDVPCRVVSCRQVLVLFRFSLACHTLTGDSELLIGTWQYSLESAFLKLCAFRNWRWVILGWSEIQKMGSQMQLKHGSWESCRRHKPLKWTSKMSIGTRWYPLTL